MPMHSLGSPGLQGGIVSTGRTSLTTTKKPAMTMLMLLQQPPHTQVSHHAQHPSAPANRGATRGLDFAPHAPPRLCRSLPGWQPSHLPFTGDLPLHSQLSVLPLPPASFLHPLHLCHATRAASLPPRSHQGMDAPRNLKRCSTKSNSEFPVAHQGLQHPPVAHQGLQHLPWTFQGT